MSRSDELEEVSYSFSERFMILLCNFSFVLYIALTLESMLLLLALLSLLFGDVHGGTKVVLWLDFVLLAIAIIPTVAGIAVCRRR